MVQSPEAHGVGRYREGNRVGRTATQRTHQTAPLAAVEPEAKGGVALGPDSARPLPR